MSQLPILVPASRLLIDPRNVRKARSAAFQAQMKASVAAKGIIQNLVGRPVPRRKGWYYVSAGGSRLDAVNANIADGIFAADYPVPLLVRDGKDGRLCWGDIARPRTLGIASIADFERAVFDSWSTHPNPGQDLTITGKGGLVRLWDELAARKAERFPVRRLRPFQPGAGRHGRQRAGSATRPLTVGTLIARSRR